MTLTVVSARHSAAMRHVVEAFSRNSMSLNFIDACMLHRKKRGLWWRSTADRQAALRDSDAVCYLLLGRGSASPGLLYLMVREPGLVIVDRSGYRSLTKALSKCGLKIHPGDWLGTWMPMVAVMGGPRESATLATLVDGAILGLPALPDIAIRVQRAHARIHLFNALADLSAAVAPLVSHPVTLDNVSAARIASLLQR